MVKTAGQDSGLILMDAHRINRAIGRMACQILEDTPETDDLILLGIDERGYSLAIQLANALESQSGNKISCLQMVVRDDSEIQDQLGRLDGYSGNLILVDDVLFSGTTLMKALRRIMDMITPENLQICVLVDRGHHCYPLTARYTGLNSPTKLGEHVIVSFGPDDMPESVILTRS
jgi:pyrimidine operon attenuation protein / uracil phosphoribosyltransferase